MRFFFSPPEAEVFFPASFFSAGALAAGALLAAGFFSAAPFGGILVDLGEDLDLGLGYGDGVDKVVDMGVVGGGVVSWLWMIDGEERREGKGLSRWRSLPPLIPQRKAPW